MRIYDPRLGRFLSVDPITQEYPELTPYQFASNRPIDGIDMDGLEYTPAGRYGPNQIAVDATAVQHYPTNPLILQKQVEEAPVRLSIKTAKAIKQAVSRQVQPAMRQYREPDAARSEKNANLSFAYKAQHPEPTSLEKNIHFQKFADNIALPMISYAAGDGAAKVVGESFSLLSGVFKSKNLYRFDTRGILEINKSGGFNSWGSEMNLIEHANGNNIFNKTSGYVPTSSTFDAALKYAGEREGFIYKIKPQSNGLDVNKILGKLSPYPLEKEIAIPLNIPASAIKSVQKVGGR